MTFAYKCSSHEKWKVVARCHPIQTCNNSVLTSPVIIKKRRMVREAVEPNWRGTESVLHAKCVAALFNMAGL